MNLSPLLGIEASNLLLEGLNQRIAYLEHRLQTGCFANEHLETSMASVLKSLRQERDELMAAATRVVQFQSQLPVVVATAEKEQ